MRGTIPVEEFNIKEISDNIKKKQDEKLAEIKEENRQFLIKKLEYFSLDEIANNINSDNSYQPYLVDFAIIMNRLQNDLEVDKDIEAMQVKVDILNQLSKMKKLPPLNTECHIESKYCMRCRSLKSFLLKSIFRKKKYRLVFHRKEATFDEEFCKINHISFFGTIILLLLIFDLTNGIICVISLIIAIIVAIIWFILS